MLVWDNDDIFWLKHYIAGLYEVDYVHYRYLCKRLASRYCCGNATDYKYNGRLIEENVNKIELTKRIMYDRNRFQLLKAKLVLNEYFYQIS